MNTTVDYEIDSSDWQSGTTAEKDKCVLELGNWFEKLSAKSQVAIFYAQAFRTLSPDQPDCPWLTMVQEAENRIFTKNTKHFVGEITRGFNLFLTTKPQS